MTIADKLQLTLDTKQAIKQALIDKGAEPSDVFSTYPSLIEELAGGGGDVQFVYRFTANAIMRVDILSGTTIWSKSILDIGWPGNSSTSDTSYHIVRGAATPNGDVLVVSERGYIAVFDADGNVVSQTSEFTDIISRAVPQAMTSDETGFYIVRRNGGFKLDRDCNQIYSGIFGLGDLGSQYSVGTLKIIGDLIVLVADRVVISDKMTGETILSTSASSNFRGGDAS